jgi:hypothetical protein
MKAPNPTLNMPLFSRRKGLPPTKTFRPTLLGGKRRAGAPRRGRHGSAPCAARSSTLSRTASTALGACAVHHAPIKSAKRAIHAKTIQAMERTLIREKVVLVYY